jgi:hypothetical protein
MPYVDKVTREVLQSKAKFADHPGQLNYLFTQQIIAYVKENGLSYQTINDVVGALEGCKLEFYRRVAVPYEETKIKENGDVYPDHMIGKE